MLPAYVSPEQTARKKKEKNHPKNTHHRFKKAHPNIPPK